MSNSDDNEYSQPNTTVFKPVPLNKVAVKLNKTLKQLSAATCQTSPRGSILAKHKNNNADIEEYTSLTVHRRKFKKKSRSLSLKLKGCNTTTSAKSKASESSNLGKETATDPNKLTIPELVKNTSLLQYDDSNSPCSSIHFSRIPPHLQAAWVDLDHSNREALSTQFFQGSKRLDHDPSNGPDWTCRSTKRSSALSKS